MPPCRSRSHLPPASKRSHLLSSVALLVAVQVAALCAAAVSASSAGSSTTEVLHLPGLHQHKLPSRHFAGYITVDATSGRQLYYYLVTHEGTHSSEGPQGDSGVVTNHQRVAGVAADQRHASSAAQHDSRGDSSSGGGDSDSTTTPLIIWLTGGPGCSSLDAFTYEHGPFVFAAPAAEAEGRDPTLADIQLNPNPYSWSKTAHILYIDSPAGTGFSYTPGTTGKYHTSDDKTIADLVAFVEGFFAEHPWLNSQPLYIAGESYGGVYVPLLARALLQHNQRLVHAQQQQQQQQPPQPQHAAPVTSTVAAAAAREERRYNLVGYIVGNAVTDALYDTRGQAEFAFGHGLVDPSTYHDVKRACKANGWDTAEPHSPCSTAFDTLEAAMGSVNHYSILEKCYEPNKPKPKTASLQQGQQKQQTVGAGSSSERAEGAGQSVETAAAGVASSRGGGDSRGGGGGGGDSSVDFKLLKSSRRLQQRQLPQQQQAPSGRSSWLRTVQRLGHAVSCADRRYAMVYYNNPAVRQAIHAASEEESGKWEPCSDVLSYNQTAGSMIPVHQELLDAGLRGLVLSGDMDYVVPYTGTRAWVYDLGLKEAKPWHPWSLSGDDQVAGYAVSFKDGLTFATVKAAGHMIPQSAPQASLSLLQQWMDDRL